MTRLQLLTVLAAFTATCQANDCYTMVGGNAVYSGTTSVTINNHACQKWSSQSPNKHGYIDSYFSVTNGDASPGYAGASNYCRDPSGGNLKPEGFAWCYVASGKTRWERCDIPRCPATTTNAATTAPVRRPAPPRTAATSANDCYTMVGGNAVYSGTTSVTINNHACQKWSSQSPNKHGYIDSYFSVTNGDASPGYAGASNYCRDPSGGNLKPEGFAWCYVASGKTRWERCDIPRCPATTTNAATTAPVRRPAPPRTAATSANDCYTMVGGNAVYSGTTSVTINNHACQKWSSQSPNKHGYIDSYFSVTNGDASPGYAGASNYCRDPSGGNLKPEGFAWCYVASGKTRWERCDIPRCPATTTNAATTAPVRRPAPPRTAATSANDCYTMVGGNAVYSGTTSVTINNHACQKWSSQSPNKHGYIDSYFSVTNGDASPGYAGASNYCRDPSGGNLKPEGFAWCYVASGKTRWERCDIPRCPATTTNAATTAPVRRPAPPRTAATSANDCYTMVGGNAVYSGTTSVTINNHACQKWSSQSPNKHGYIDSYFSVTNGDASPGYAGASNYCRDPSGGDLKPEGFAWCYVASGKTRWERCDIPRCPATTTNAATTSPAPPRTAAVTTTVAATAAASANECYTMVGGNAVYSGTTSVTINNRACQKWSSQSPNKHGYIDSYFSITNGDAGPGYAGASNYCRDPSGGNLKPEGFAWCYVASGKTRWERCDIPRCPATTTNAATTAGPAAA